MQIYMLLGGGVDLAGVIRADAYAELSLDKGVVNQVGHVLERLPIVFTDTETKS